MPKPVPIPAGPLVATNADIARAEGFVAALAQVFKAGTSGGSLITEPFLIPDTSNPNIDPALRNPVPVVIATEEEQIYYRQIAHALALSLVRFASSTVPGISYLNRDPADPALPTALNAEDVSVSPAPNKIPRADNLGLIDPAWIGEGPGPTPTPDNVYTTTCLSSVAVGDLVCYEGHARVETASCHDSTFRVPVLGCVISKADPTHCTVQTSDVVSGIYTGLAPGRIYYLGETGRPVLFSALPAASESTPVIAQAIGMALTATLLLINPSTVVTRKKG